MLRKTKLLVYFLVLVCLVFNTVKASPRNVNDNKAS
ncbi:MAG: hypothetical protein FD167_1141, partial [bacterium]